MAAHSPGYNPQKPTHKEVNMRRILLLVLFVIALPASGFAQGAAAKQTAAPSGDSQALIKLDRDLMDGMIKKDDSLMNRTALDDYVFVNPGGGLEIRSKSAGPGPTFESVNTEQVNVHVTGDTAILTGLATIKAKLPNGTDISGPYRYMRVFVKQNGQWRLAAASATEIRPAPSPSAPKS